MSIRTLGYASILVLLAVTGCPAAQSGESGESGDESPAEGGDPDAGMRPPVGDGDGVGVGGRAGQFFLPTGEPDNTAAPRVEIDTRGGVHAVYPAYAGGRAYYAYCAAGCSDADDVHVVRFDTDGSVANAMLALTAAGQPRVVLSTAQHVYFATCDAQCSEASAWTTRMILDHEGNREVSGEALALDPRGRPRFVLHTYRSLLGFGQKAPETLLASCDAGCDSAAAWRFDVIQDQIWEGSHLRYDAKGRAHLATVVTTFENGVPSHKQAAYLVCESGACATADDWRGIGLMNAFESMTDAVSIEPTVALALTRDGGPRVLVLAADDAGARQIVYFECDEDCYEDHWSGSIISNSTYIGAGLDLALDARDRPRFVYTLDYDIALAFCDKAPCSGPTSQWDLQPVEHGSDIPTDQIFLWENCHVGAWFLHSPSLALTASGEARVGYQARDISGGLDNPDPTKPDCEAGTDMTWSRLAVMK